jgi:hypothetical protein
MRLIFLSPTPDSNQLTTLWVSGHLDLIASQPIASSRLPQFPFSQIESLLYQTKTPKRNLSTWLIIFPVLSFFAERVFIYPNLWEALHLVWFFFYLSNVHCSIENIRDWFLWPKLYPRTNINFMLQKISKKSCGKHFIFSWEAGLRGSTSQVLIWRSAPHRVKALKGRQTEPLRGGAFCKCYLSQPGPASW